MPVSRRYVFSQGPVIGALVRTAVASLRKTPPPRPDLPGVRLRETVPPRSEALIRDYVRHLGGDAASYKGVLPAHLFSQWGFPLLARTLLAIPYDMRRVLNGGCRIEMHRPLPANEPLELEAWLEDIDDNGSRAVIKNRLTTGTKSAPGAVDAWMYAVVPLERDKSGKKKERPIVPHGAREIGRTKLTPQHAVDFALLTGDFNPVHWLPPYARAAGFKSTILHGFATLGRAIEALNRNRFAGDPTRLATVDVKFTRPLVLPARVGIYVEDHTFFVGTAAGGPAFLTGTFEERHG